jgi:hypothetical protein
MKNYEITLVLRNGSIQRLVLYRKDPDKFDPFAYAEEFSAKHKFDVKYTSIHIFGELQ